MQKFIGDFVEHENVVKVCGESEHMKEWLIKFEYKNMSDTAVKDLFALATTAHDKSKVVMMDLIRLILCQEVPAQFAF